MSPDIIIIDRFLEDKENLKIFNENRKQAFCLIIQEIIKKSINIFLKLKNLKIIKISKLEN